MTQLAFEHVERTYPGASPVYALRDATTEINQGDYVAIKGPSGAGKSTFLNIMALLDTPTGGDYWINGQNTADLNDHQLAVLRSETFSFVFQSFHLILSRSVLDNVMLGLVYRGIDPDETESLAAQALEFVGLTHKANARASLLSGGESQRVAIARAIATGAPVLVADEPTGNLDSGNSEAIMDLLDQLNQQGKTVVIVTHDDEVARRATRSLYVLDGIMEEQSGNEIMDEAADSATETSPPPGTPSKITMRSFLRDAWTSVVAASGRSIGLVTMVIFGVALTLTTIGLAQTARYQVTDAFDTNQNRRVAISTDGESENDKQQAAQLAAATDQETIDRISAVPGVQAVSLITAHADVNVAARPTDTEKLVQFYGIYPNEPDQQLFEIDRRGNPDTPLADDEVLVGSGLAIALDLGPVISSPTVWVQGRPMRVVGVVKDAGMRSELPNSIIMNTSTANGFSPISSTAIEIRTQPGAAQQVAEYAPLAWDPTLADSFIVQAPGDPTAMRDEIDQSVSTILLTLTVVSALAALLTLTNSMATGVQRRTEEFGMRRAIGCRRRHLASLMATESTIIGLIGGVGGTILAIFAILLVTLIQRWQPVMDFALIPLGIIGGVLVGVLGSLVAIRRAVAVTPAAALRAH